MRGLARARGGPLSRTRVTAMAVAAALAGGTAALAITTGGTAAQASSAVRPQAPAHYQGPRLTLIPATHDLTVQGFPKSRTSKQVQVYVDPGVWLASIGSPFQLDVERANYRAPVTLTQVIDTPGGTRVTRPLPASMLDHWNGIEGMIRLTVRYAGHLVSSQSVTFCPNTFDPERAVADSPDTSPYPQQGCAPFDPFPLGEVWGVAKGWAVDPASSFLARPFSLVPNRTYQVTESITPRYTHWFGVAPADASATVNMTVTVPTGFPPPTPSPSPTPSISGTATASSSPSAAPTPTISASASVPPPAAGVPAGAFYRLPTRARTSARPAGPLPALPAVPSMKNPPAGVLPDLAPLPAWGLTIAHTGSKKVVGHDYLNFGATVAVGGNGPLDVEAFRADASPVMKAYQYFYRNGKVVGRIRAGTMDFDKAKGHNHWHFEQFARYSLLSANKKLVVRSLKVGFCIAPTDAVNLLLRNAVWNPGFTGFGGQCGSPTALWVREMMPVGWGDTYEQFLAGQAFDITNLKNGTYYVAITANPGHVLKETNYRNDMTLRKVIISGAKGHRHFTVPAYDGIDPEHG
jgi:Lysyl oxidase